MELQELPYFDEEKNPGQAREDYASFKPPLQLHVIPEVSVPHKIIIGP
jgi:hypothetical protein